MQNWLVRTMVYIYFHFLILFSRIALRSDWWVSFVVEYISAFIDIKEVVCFMLCRGDDDYLADHPLCFFVP